MVLEMRGEGEPGSSAERKAGSLSLLGTAALHACHSGSCPLGGAHRLSWPTGCSAFASLRGKVVEQEHSVDASEPPFRFLAALIATAPYGTDEG